MSERWITVKNWERFQHYRDRGPTWIKLYTELNRRDDWRRLTFAERGLLTSIWVEYGVANGVLRVSDLGGRCGQRVDSRALASLNDAGFIVFSASRPLALARSREEETETEVEKRGSPRSKTSPIEARPQAAGVYAQELARLAATNGNGTGTHEPDEPYFDRLLATVGNTETNFAKLRRASRHKPTAAIIAALEAAQNPDTREPIAIALTVLANYGQEG